MSQVKRVLLGFVYAVDTLFVAVVVFVFFYVATYRLPPVIYSLRSPAPEAECSRITLGMRRDEVLGVIGSSVRPYYLYAEGTVLKCEREGCGPVRGKRCVVEFDPDSDRVWKVYMEDCGWIVKE
jgi:hypothetical protein